MQKIQFTINIKALPTTLFTQVTFSLLAQDKNRRRDPPSNMAAYFISIATSPYAQAMNSSKTHQKNCKKA